MFASRSVPVHVVRGIVGAVLLVASFVLAKQAHPLFILLLVPAGFAFRGCPTCWAMGLGQTRARTKRDVPNAG